MISAWITGSDGGGASQLPIVVPGTITFLLVLPTPWWIPTEGKYPPSGYCEWRYDIVKRGMFIEKILFQCLSPPSTFLLIQALAMMKCSGDIPNSSSNFSQTYLQMWNN